MAAILLRYFSEVPTSKLRSMVGFISMFVCGGGGGGGGFCLCSVFSFVRVLQEGYFFQLYALWCGVWMCGVLDRGDDYSMAVQYGSPVQCGSPVHINQPTNQQNTHATQLVCTHTRARESSGREDRIPLANN